MIEAFITVMSVIIIIKGVCNLVYFPIIKKYFNQKTYKFSHFFQFTSMNFWYLFYMSILWLIVYYFDFIKEYVFDLYILSIEFCQFIYLALVRLNLP